MMLTEEISFKFKIFTVVSIFSSRPLQIGDLLLDTDFKILDICFFMYV